MQSEKQQDNPFEVVSDVEVSRKDQYIESFDRYVATSFRIVWHDWRARIGLLIIAGYLFMGTAGVLLVEPTQTGDGGRLVSAFSTWEYPLGTDTVGRDLFAQTVHATPAMLQMILAGALFSTSIATIVGIVSGYKGGVVDRLLMYITDVVINIPGLPLIIVLAAFIETGHPIFIGIVLSINAWAGLARTIRSQVLTIRNEASIEASRCMGLSLTTIVAKDITPRLMPYISINFVNTARGIIFASVGLYFLGILPYSSTNWGVMLNRAYEGGALQTSAAAHWLLIPLIVIVLLSVGLILLAQGMDRIFNPQVRARHMDNEATDEEELQ